MHQKYLFWAFPLFCITTTSKGIGTTESDKQFAEWTGRQFANRMLWMTHKRRFVLPKGTILQVTPKVTVPVFRHAPYNGGFDSDIQASWTFYMKFDKLNMTSDDHPWPFFDRPPFYPFGEMMRPNVDGTDNKKDAPSQQKKPQNHHHFGGPNNKPFPNIVQESSSSEQDQSLHTVRVKNIYPSFHHRRPRRRAVIMSLPPPESIFGGERAIILPSIEGLMTSMGLAGRACLLRAVCEVHEFPLGTGGYGLFGELITLFFSISESPYAESHMPEYLKAEEYGKAANCSSYKKSCQKSIFVWEPRHESMVNNVNEDQVKENAI